MIDTDRLLHAIELPDLVEREAKAKLHRYASGVNCACPIHQGKNVTAFSMFEDNGVWYWRCHTGCGRGGTAIQFIMAYKNFDFMEAIKFLADFARIALDDLGLTPQAIEAHKQAEARSDVLDLAAQYYYCRLLHHAPARAYTRKRGFTFATARAAQLGYSDGRGLDEWLRAHNGDMTLAHELGLLRRDGTDFTANGNGAKASPQGYLIYPHRVAGRVVYFSSRAITPKEAMPKAEDKSRNLIGDKLIYRADVRYAKSLLLVEGQADALSSQQLQQSAWALCGTALDENDVRAMRRYKVEYLALDTDEVRDGSEDEKRKRIERGIERRRRLAEMIGPLCMVTPPFPAPFKDMNDWLTGGATPDDVQTWLQGSRAYIDVALEQAKSKQAFELDDTINEMCTLISALPVAMQGRYIKKAESVLGVPARDLRAKIKKVEAENAGPLCAEVSDGALCFLGDKLGNYQAAIVLQSITEDGLNPSKIEFTIEGSLANGKPLTTINRLPVEEFESLKWIMKYWGADAITHIPPSRLWTLKRAIQEISASGMRREHIYKYTGWSLVDGKRAFLSASGALTAEGLRADVRVDLGGEKLNLYALPVPPEDPRAAMQASLAFLDLAPLTVTAPIWAALFASVLMPFKTLFATMWVYGSSQSLKSTLVMLALCHFGKGFVSGREYRAPRDWLSTFVDLEIALFTTKDIPLVIDDYAPQSSEEESRKLKQKAGQILRMVGNRSAKGRGQSDLTARAQMPPRSFLIATAEKFWGGGAQSNEARYIPILVKPDDVRRARQADSGESPLDTAQKDNGLSGPGTYSLAMAAYIRWVARHWEQLEETLPKEYEAAAQEARRVFPPNWSRLTDYYAVLFVASKTALRFALRCGAIAPERHDELVNQIGAALITVLMLQSERISEQSPVRRFFEALNDLLGQNKAYLARKGGELPTMNGEPPRPSTPPAMNSMLVGWYDPEKPIIYLLTTPCLGMVRNYFSGAGEGFDVTAEALLREIGQADIQAAKEEGRNTDTVWMGPMYGTQRVLAIDDHAAQKKFGVTLHRTLGAF